MIKGVVIPHSSGGLTGAVMLGLGRAMGETVAVALVIGASPQISANLFGKGETMPGQILRSLSEAGGIYRSALIGLGVCLFVLTVLINMSARRMVVAGGPTHQGDRMSATGDRATSDRGGPPGAVRREPVGPASLHATPSPPSRWWRRSWSPPSRCSSWAYNVVSQGIGVVMTTDWWTQPIPGDVSRADLAGNEDLCALGFGDPDECESGGSTRPTS